VPLSGQSKSGDQSPHSKLFLAPSGRQWEVANLSRTYSRLRDQAGLPRDLVLYLARHECGTTYRRQTTSSYSSCNREGARPILPVAALLRLADWCRQRALIQGEESCEQARKDWSPPAHRNIDSCSSAERTVAGRTGSQTASGPAASESNPGSLDCDASRGNGGAA
jgi:hypothetical protein